MIKTFIVLVIGLMGGCSSAPRGRIIHVRSTTRTTYTREVVLSRQHPKDDFLKARLVTVAEDGTTTIEAGSTHDLLRAAPGHFFSSTNYGTEGLQLISASAQTQEARFLRTWCETK